MRKLLDRNAITHLARVTWHYAEGHRWWVALYGVMAAAAVIVALLAPLVFAKLMNAVQELSGEELTAQTGLIMAATVGISVLFWMLHGPSRVMETVIAFIVKRALQTALFRKATLLPTRWHRDNHSGETIDQSAKAAQALGDFTESGFEVIHFIVRFFGAIAVLTYMMPFAGLTVLAVSGLAIFVVVLFDRVLIKQYEVLNKRFNEVAASIQDYLTNVSTVISLRLEDRVSEEVSDRIGRIKPLWRKNAIVNELKWFCASMVIDFTKAGIVFGYVYMMVKSGKVIEVGTMYALIEYLRAIDQSFFQFTWKYGDLVVKSTRVHAVDHIDEAYEREVSETVNAHLPADWQAVTISELCFTHGEEADGTVRPAVSDLNLRFERGKSYAFVGESGSGKSTVLGLLRGIHLTQHGSVACNGEMLPHGLAHVAHHCTLIPQDPEIFSDSIRFNITMDVEATDEAVMQAVNLARFDAKLKKLPRGLATSIAEKGVSLSGGERQRLALARGLFFAEESGSDIILMDEPTSSVDKHNERLIYKALLEHFSDRCVIAAVHNLDLLHLFDEVLVFSGGHLVEQGPARELIYRGGELTRIFRGEAA